MKSGRLRHMLSPTFASSKMHIMLPNIMKVAIDFNRVFGETAALSDGKVEIKELLARYSQVRDLIPMGAYVPGADARTDQAVQRWPLLEAYLRQGTHEAAMLPACMAQLQEVLA